MNTLLRKCEHCGAPFRKHRSEQRYCSRKCFLAFRDLRRTAQTKTCPNCGERFTRARGLSDDRWFRKKCCGPKCGAELSTKTLFVKWSSLRGAMPEEKICGECRRRFRRRVGERPWRFMRRQHCGQDCGRKFRARVGRSRLAQTGMSQPRHMLPSGPLETVEAYLARGGKITRIEIAHKAPLGGIPAWPTYPQGSSRRAAA